MFKTAPYPRRKGFDELLSSCRVKLALEAILAKKGSMWLTFSICSASRRSLGSLKLGLKVSGSRLAVMDVPCLEFTSSFVVI